MALRAGYYGVKGNLLSVISKLGGAKIIKSIGDGLKLTSAGKLSCDIDSDTMEFKNGKLAAKSTGFDYSETPVKTGQKWIDGKDVYCVVKLVESLTVPGGATFGNIDLTDFNIDTPIDSRVMFGGENPMPWVTDSAASTIGYKYTKTVLGFRKASTGGSAIISNIVAILYFTVADN